MKKLLKFFLVIVGSVIGPAVFAVEDYAGWTGAGPYTDGDEVFVGLEGVLGNFTLFFGVFVVLAILVTGFFLGRKWLRRVG